MRQRIRRVRLHRFQHSLQRPVEQDEVGRIGIDRQPRRDALQHVLLGIGRNPQDGEGAARKDRILRLAVARGAQRDRYVAVRLQRLDQPAAEFAVVLVHHRDRNVAHDLAQIRLRIEERVEHRRQHEQREHAAIGKRPPPLRREGPRDAGRCRPGRRLDLLGNCQAAPDQRAEAQPDQQRENHGDAAEDGERLGGVTATRRRAWPGRTGSGYTIAAAGSRPTRAESHASPARESRRRHSRMRATR